MGTIRVTGKGQIKVRPEFRLSYTVSDPGAAKNELLGNAVTDAKEKAAVLTQDVAVTLKDIQSIDYSWGERSASSTAR